MSNSETFESICAVERHSWKHLTKMGTEERLFLRSWQQNSLLRSCGCHCCCYITLSLGRSHLGGNFMAIFSRKGALFWSPPHLLHPSVMFSGCRESRFSSVMLYSKALNISTPWVVVAMFFPQILAGVVGAISRPIWHNVRRARAQPRVRTLPLAKSSPAAHSTVFTSSLVSN